MLPPPPDPSPWAAAPPDGPGICPVCHGCSVQVGRAFCASTGRPSQPPSCLSCRRVARQLNRALVPVIPMAVCTNGRWPARGGTLYDLVRRYKWDLPCHALSSLRATLATLFVTFLSRHGACIVERFGGPWDFTTHVPSSKGRPGGHPLGAMVQMSSLLPIRHREVLVNQGLYLSHCNADARGFRTVGGVPGARVLLFDDTYVTGSRAQSAAAALHDAGAIVVAIVAVSRVVDPAYSRLHATWWEENRIRAFDFDVCCLEEFPAALVRAA